MNHANDRGGALYFEDSQCLKASTAPLECFISILNHRNCSYPNGKNITLFFKHNSVGSTGSTPYGGHLSECRLYYRTTYKLESNTLCTCDTKLSNNYSINAFEVFLNISKIIPHNKLVASISSPAKQIKFCIIIDIFRIHRLLLFEWMHYWIRHAYYSCSVHPGKLFNITIKALDQAGSPVSASILIENLK